MCEEIPPKTIKIDLDRQTAGDLQRQAEEAGMGVEDIAGLLLEMACDKILDRMSTPKR